MDKLRLIMDCDCTMGVPGCDVDDGLALLYVLGCPEAEILSFDGGSVHSCEYTETESYRITELFINDREKLIRLMLQE